MTRLKPLQPRKNVRKGPPLPFVSGMLSEVLPRSYWDRLLPGSQTVASQIPVVPNPNLPGGLFFYQSGGPLGHIEASRNSPTLLFHELSHGIEHLPNEYLPNGMFRGEMGEALWPLLSPDRQAVAERLYGDSANWGPGEYYPMIGQMYNWNPQAMPEAVRPYYSPWFRSTPDPRDLSFGLRRRAYNGYPNRWTGGP